MLIHKDDDVSAWVTGIKSSMVGMCEDSFVIPIIALFYNDAATGNILESKRRTWIELAAIEQRRQIKVGLSWSSFRERMSGLFESWRDRMEIRIREWRNRPPVEAMDQCLGAPEFEILKYLHNLTEHMAAWSTFPDKFLPQEQLPKRFVDVKGQLDAPLSVYDSLCRIQEVADAFIPAEMQRTMFAVLLSEIMIQPQQRNRAHRE
jgi:hypothetical protein